MKQWLLIASIMMHVICVMFSSGGFIIISTIIATNPCYSLQKREKVCYTNNLPVNIAMIVLMIILGVISMITFSIFLVKLIRVFNGVQSKIMQWSQMCKNLFIFFDLWKVIISKNWTKFFVTILRRNKTANLYWIKFIFSLNMWRAHKFGKQMVVIWYILSFYFLYIIFLFFY